VVDLGCRPPDDAWIDWGGAGTLIHVAHANGFPPASYRTLIRKLTPAFHVLSMAARPLWPGFDPGGIGDWAPLVEDLRVGMRARGLERVVGVGHSLGGTLTARVAAADPTLFCGLVLVDPVIFTWPRSWFWMGVQRLRLAGSFTLVASARQRREHWPDLESVRRSYRGKAAFAGWAPEAFEDYLEAGFVAAEGGGVRLRYPREWEARIFEVCPADVWSELRRIDLPVLFVRGGRSDTFLAAAAARARRELRRVRVVVIDGTSHFVPFEDPTAVAMAITAFAREVSG
jgi:pimeloyl-ACP methyl ester carboxylesterase